MPDEIPGFPTATRRYAVDRHPHSPLLQTTLEAEFDEAADASHFVLDYAYDGTFGLTVYDRVAKQHIFWVNVRPTEVDRLWADLTTERTARLAAEKRVVELENEIDRVAGFLHEHEFPGYSFGLPRRGVWDGKASQDGG